MGEKTKPTSELWKATLTFVAIIWVLAMGVLSTQVFINAGVGVPQLSVLLIFLLAFLIGIAGASVYVIVQMISDKDLLVFTNLFAGMKVSRSVAMIVFIVSGGLVAAMSQASTGSFETGHIWVTFLMGFGWQGVVAGVGGSSAVRGKADEAEKQQKAKEKVRSFSDTFMDRELEKREAWFRDQVERIKTGKKPEGPTGGGA